MVGMVDSPASRTSSPRHAWVVGFEGHTLEIRFPERATDEEVRAFCAILERFWRDTTGRVGVLFDCRRVLTATASQRKLFADLQARLEPVFAEKMLGAVFVIDSAIVRGLLTAIFWLRPPVYRYVVTADEAEARRWLAGLHLPANR